MKGWKNNNDPWEPLPDDDDEDSSKIQLPLPQNPLYNMMDSQQYIQTLERKLDKLKKKKECPSSKDIIDSLVLSHDDHIRNYVNSEAPCTVLAFDGTDSIPASSYMKRKLFPELQAISSSELTQLVTEDFIGKAFEELTSHNISVSNPKDNRPVEVCELNSDKKENIKYEDEVTNDYTNGQ